MASLSSWSDLPEDILAIVKTRLHSPSDIARFRSVCPSWRSSTPILETTLPFPDVFVDTITQGVININQITIYCFQPLIQTSSASPPSWLVAVQFVDGKHQFLNAITSWPPVTTLIPQELNLCNFQITELHKVYGMQNMDAPRKALYVSSQYYDETLLVVCAIDVLVFYKLENNRWVVSQKRDEMQFTDIELYQGRVWGVGYEGCTVVFDSSLDTIEVGPCLLSDDVHDACFHFVESSGDLFVVEFNETNEDGTRNQSRPLEIAFLEKDELLPVAIHKLVVEENKWVEVKHLDDKVFVLAIEFPWSFSIPSQQIPGGMKNCIISSAIDSDEYDTFVPKTCSVWDIERDEHNLLSREFHRLFWPVPDWLITGNSS